MFLDGSACQESIQLISMLLFPIVGFYTSLSQVCELVIESWIERKCILECPYTSLV